MRGTGGRQLSWNLTGDAVTLMEELWVCGVTYPETCHIFPFHTARPRGPRLTLNSSRNRLQSSADRMRISSSRCATGMGKYFLGPEGDRLRSITLCCSVGLKETQAIQPHAQVGSLVAGVHSSLIL